MLARLPVVEQEVLGGRRRVLARQGSAVNVARLKHLTTLLGQEAQELGVVGQLHLVALRLVVAGQAAPAEVFVGAGGRRGGRAFVRVGRRRDGRAGRVVGERRRLVLAQLLVNVLLRLMVVVIAARHHHSGGRPLTVHFLVRLLLLFHSIAESDEAVVVDQDGRRAGRCRCRRLRVSQSAAARARGPRHLRRALGAVNDGERRKSAGMIHRDGDGRTLLELMVMVVVVVMLARLRVRVAIVAHVGRGVGFVRGHGLDGRQVRQGAADHFSPGGGSTAVASQSIGLAAEGREGLHRAAAEGSSGKEPQGALLGGGG